MLLPTNRPPTHPGEMLLEEFLKPRVLSWMNLQNAWDLWHAQRAMQRSA